MGSSTLAGDYCRGTFPQVGREVLEQLSASQQLCAVARHKQQSGERMLALSLQHRISEVECWHGSLRAVSRRLQEQARLLADEGGTLRVVLGRIEAEIRDHVLVEHSSPVPHDLTTIGDVEIQLRKELKLLRTERKRFAKKISQVEESLVKSAETKRSIDRDMQLKSHGVRVDRQLADIIADSSTGGRISKLQSHRRWVERCASLQSSGARSALAAAMLREVCREMRARLSCAVQAQAERVDAALRRRLHLHRSQLHDFQWQMQELERDMRSMSGEQLEAERRLHECVLQGRAAAARLAARASKADSELCDDGVQRQLHSQIGQLKRSVAELGEDIARIRCLRNSLTAALEAVGCCVREREQALESDLALERRRAPPPLPPLPVASRSDAAAGGIDVVVNLTARSLTPIYECDDEGSP